MTDYTARMIQNLFELGERYNVPVKIEQDKITAGDSCYITSGHDITGVLHYAYVFIVMDIEQKLAKQRIVDRLKG